jgi:hypothetical protein
MDAERGEPASAWDAFDRWRAPAPRHDKGSSRREIHQLACTDAPHGMYAGLGEERRDHQLQEQARAGMEEPQQAHHGKAAPRPLRRRLAERLL